MIQSRNDKEGVIVRKCHNCLCQTCIKDCCGRKKCQKKVECKQYCGFIQLSIFPPQTKSKYQVTPRYSWKHYGITKERYRQLTEYIKSGKYTDIALQAAHTANEMLSEYIMLSINQNLSYDGLQRLWELRKIERMPCGRSDFYGWRRYIYSLIDKELRRIGK